VNVLYKGNKLILKEKDDFPEDFSFREDSLWITNIEQVSLKGMQHIGIGNMDYCISLDLLGKYRIITVKSEMRGLILKEDSEDKYYYYAESKKPKALKSTNLDDAEKEVLKNIKWTSLSVNYADKICEFLTKNKSEYYFMTTITGGLQKYKLLYSKMNRTIIMEDKNSSISIREIEIPEQNDFLAFKNFCYMLNNYIVLNENCNITDYVDTIASVFHIDMKLTTKGIQVNTYPASNNNYCTDYIIELDGIPYTVCNDYHCDKKEIKQAIINFTSKAINGRPIWE
jgi:hypothetical protein